MTAPALTLDVNLRPFCSDARHAELRSSLPALLAGCDRYHAQDPDASEPGWRMIAGRCADCGAELYLDVDVPENHPILEAEHCRRRAEYHRNQARTADEQLVERYGEYAAAAEEKARRIEESLSTTASCLVRGWMAVGDEVVVQLDCGARVVWDEDGPPPPALEHLHEVVS